MPEIAELLALPRNSCLVAAAGCGKTEEIVKAVKLAGGKQLILTHTNAGVASLKARLRKHLVSPSKFNVDTIASWLLKYVAGYPKTSGFSNTMPEGAEWNKVYSAATSLFQQSFVRDVIKATYCGIYVDEYQDCTLTQHQIILQLAEVLPVRVLGDPLQGIFGFRKDDPLVNWETHVLPNFYSLPNLDVPWRWKGRNQELGESLLAIRACLETGKSIDLSILPGIKWVEWSIENEIKACLAILKEKGSVIGIHKWPKDAHASAKRLKGNYSSMEEMECRDLMKWCHELDVSEGHQFVMMVLDFAKECMTVSSHVSGVDIAIQKNDQKGLVQKLGNDTLATDLLKLTVSKDWEAVIRVWDYLKDLTGVFTFRRELLDEMKRTIRTYIQGEFPSLRDIAWHIRNQTRVVGRKPERRLISRTLLIKGLEFDYAIVLNAGNLDKMHFYVAITRGCSSLTVLSSNSVFVF